MNNRQLVSATNNSSSSMQHTILKKTFISHFRQLLLYNVFDKMWFVNICLWVFCKGQANEKASEIILLNDRLGPN
jgi:hypothetical protein